MYFQILGVDDDDGVGLSCRHPCQITGWVDNQADRHRALTEAVAEKASAGIGDGAEIQFATRQLTALFNVEDHHLAGS